MSGVVRHPDHEPAGNGLSNTPLAAVGLDASPIARPVASSSQSRSATSGVVPGAIGAGTEGGDGTQHAVTPRLGRRGLGQLRSQLSDRDYSVLVSVSRFRLLSGSQLTLLFFGPSDSAARAARRCLHRLVSLHLMTRLPRRIGGVRAGSAGFVYCLSAAGHRLIGQAPRKRLSEVSDGFLEHTLDIAELYIRTLLSCRMHGGELTHVVAEPQCWRRVESANGSDWLKPDLLVVTVVGEDERHAFVEVDRGTEHSPALLRKLRQYELAYRLGVVGVEPGIFPRVVWVVPNEHRAIMLVRLVESTPGLTTELHVVAVGVEAGVVALSGIGGDAAAGREAAS